MVVIADRAGKNNETHSIGHLGWSAAMDQKVFRPTRKLPTLRRAATGGDDW
jgi:hypothetical protein